MGVFVRVAENFDPWTKRANSYLPYSTFWVSNSPFLAVQNSSIGESVSEGSPFLKSGQFKPVLAVSGVGGCKRLPDWFCPRPNGQFLMIRFQLILPVDSHNVTKNRTGHRMHVEGPQICQMTK